MANNKHAYHQRTVSFIRAGQQPHTNPKNCIWVWVNLRSSSFQTTFKELCWGHMWCWHQLQQSRCSWWSSQLLERTPSRQLDSFSLFLKAFHLPFRRACLFKLICGRFLSPVAVKSYVNHWPSHHSCGLLVFFSTTWFWSHESRCKWLWNPLGWRFKGTLQVFNWWSLGCLLFTVDIDDFFCSAFKPSVSLVQKVLLSSKECPLYWRCRWTMSVFSSGLMTFCLRATFEDRPTTNPWSKVSLLYISCLIFHLSHGSSYCCSSIVSKHIRRCWVLFSLLLPLVCLSGEEIAGETEPEQCCR